MTLKEARTCVRLDEPTFSYDGSKVSICLSPTRWIDAQFIIATEAKG